MTRPEAFAALREREEAERARKSEFAKAATLISIAANNVEDVLAEVTRLEGTLRDVVATRALDQLPGDEINLTTAIKALNHYRDEVQLRMKEAKAK